MALAEKYQDQQKEVIEIQEKLQVNTYSDRIDIRLAERGHSNPGEKLKKVLNYI